MTGKRDVLKEWREKLNVYAVKEVGHEVLRRNQISDFLLRPDFNNMLDIRPLNNHQMCKLYCNETYLIFNRKKDDLKSTHKGDELQGYNLAGSQ